MSTENRPIRWKKEGMPSTSRVMMGIWAAVILSTLALVFFATQMSSKNHTPSEKTVVKQAKEEPVAKNLPSFSFEGAKTIFVVVAKPSEKLLKDLETAHQAGAKIQLITIEKIEVPYNVVTVDPQRITCDAVLINGASWYPISP